MLKILGPVHTGTIAYRYLSFRSRKLNAQGLRSHGNAFNRSVLFQKMDRFQKCKKSGTVRNRSVPFRCEQEIWPENWNDEFS